MHEPHWLIQELAGEAVWTAVSLGTIAAWKYRDAIARKLPKGTMIVHLTGVESDEIAGKLVQASASITGTSHVAATATVGKSVTAIWNIEAPTPSLARRLEELAAWYLHVS